MSKAEVEKWRKRLEKQFEYNLKFSNMDNETALEIVDTIVSWVLTDIKDEDGWSDVEGLVERVYERFVNIKEARL